MIKHRVIGWLIALLTLLVFLSATHNAFINYDDNVYVTKNSVVQNGITAHGIRWAFDGWHASNWHPLTWLSHMADCDLFRLNPAGHHLTSILFHAINAALLFTLILRLTSALWPSALIAALFAWHPLHVESVAWVAERKDVLSTFFALLALLAYVKFAKENHRKDFWLTFLFLALGLLSKSMLVTLPAVMLLLDGWPLQRFNNSTPGQLLCEKIPFFALSAAACIITFFAQKDTAVISLAKVSLSLRVENAVVAYVAYLVKAFWPAHLCIFYPLPKEISVAAITIAVVVLVLISAAAWICRKEKPYLLVGWLWYLGMLVPVIGLVQVGDQAMADRYTYLPIIGIFIAIVFLMNDLVHRFQFLKMPFGLVAIFILAACVILTQRQLSYWRNSEILFRHALQVKQSDLAYLNLGSALQEQNRMPAALEAYQQALQLNRYRPEVYNNVAIVLAGQGKASEALPYCEDAVRIAPNSALSHCTYGNVLVQLDRFDAATNEFFSAIRLDSSYAMPHFQLGRIFLRQGRSREALAQLHEALRIDPNNFVMLIFVSRVLASDDQSGIRNGAEALALADHAAKLNRNSVALDTLATACAENGNFDEAMQLEQDALRSISSGNDSVQDTKEIQQRLELYRERRPWRESFEKN